jgi:starch-binding outer membrane protein, SusD/RagB family
MKNIIQIILMLVLITVVSSCEDILTEKPKSFLTPGVFPTTEQDAIAATNAAYSRIYAGARDLYVASFPSDITFQGYHNKRPLTWFTGLDAFNGDSNSIWRTAFEGISRCNTVIDLVPLVDMNTETRDRLVGEAKYCRAWYYFRMVQLYGGLPIIDKVLEGPDELEGISRASVADVYTLVKQDCIDAIAVLPDAYGSTEMGRATKWAAIGLLAKVHLVLEEWGDANTRCNEIIASGQFGLYADYNKNFGEANEHQMFPDKDGALVMENIWDVQFAREEKGHTVTQQSGSRDVEVGGVVNHYGGYENMLPTEVFLTYFEPGDTRLAISYITEIDGNVLNSTRTPGAGPISGKYHNPTLAPQERANNSGNNINFLRYADILLMQAEADNELGGPTAAAYTSINLVRERAGIPPLSGLTQDGFRQAVRKELACELSFEGHRRLDLLRWGIFVETIRNSTSMFMTAQAAAIQDFHNLLPVPNNEVESSNGSIAQNPGYASTY